MISVHEGKCPIMFEIFASSNMPIELHSPQINSRHLQNLFSVLTQSSPGRREEDDVGGVLVVLDQFKEVATDELDAIL